MNSNSKAPRSQLAVRTAVKGALIDAGAGKGRAVYDNLLRQTAHDHPFAQRFPEATMPLLQRYHSEAVDRIYSLSGFRDISGTRVIMRAAHKVLQSPRRLGVGLCFEEADVIPDLAERWRDQGTVIAGIAENHRDPLGSMLAS